MGVGGGEGEGGRGRKRDPWWCRFHFTVLLALEQVDYRLHLYFGTSVEVFSW